MKKGLTAAGIFLGLILMLTPVFGFQAPEKGAEPDISTIAGEAPARAQYFVSSDGDAEARHPATAKSRMPSMPPLTDRIFW